jgi:DNA-binding winged helix-turn-helix (wHTH) protein/tetratricopeptide (TPR) repeat protein
MIYAFEGYQADTSLWQLSWQGESIAVSRKSFDLLLLLLRARPRVVTREELFEALWPGQYVEENNLAQQISLLRKVFSKHGDARIIETVPGRGYRLAAVVIETPITGLASASAPEVVLRAEQSITRITLEEEVETGSEPGFARLPSSAAGKRVALYISVGAFVLLGVAAWFGWQRWQNHTGGPPVQVVLMPLEGSTGDTVLDRALSDAVRFDLAQSPFVTLISAATVSQTMHDMLRKPSEALTQETAREVCERTNSQAVVRALLAHDGKGYLVTGEAVSCVNGGVLASTSRQVDRPEDLPLAINRLLGNIRQNLGESRRSVARFTTPVFALQTSSLEALKAASQAGLLNQQGKFSEAVAMEKQAISLDPDFATAYFDLTTDYISLHDMPNATASITKAYELRKTASPLIQISITSRYVEIVTGDLREAERNDVLWTELYPSFPVAWNTLGNVRHFLGEYPGAAEAAAKALSLRPNISTLYSNLAQERLFNGDTASARSQADHSIALADNELPHLILARIAFQQHDSALARQQLDWGVNHPSSPTFLASESELAIAEGRFEDARKLLSQSDDAFNLQGSGAAADSNKEIASEFLFAGDLQDGSFFFHKEPLDPENGDDLVALALMGDAAQSERLLKQAIAKRPKDTLLNFWTAPIVRAVNALAAKHPQDAIAALTAPGVLANIDGQIPELLGTAYLEAHQPQSAETAFRSALSHPEHDYEYALSLSWLGLGRALAEQQKRGPSIDAYQHFLHAWQHADPSAAKLVAAKQEFAKLQGP